jgi:hypothetical protein
MRVGVAWARAGAAMAAACLTTHVLAGETPAPKPPAQPKEAPPAAPKDPADEKPPRPPLPPLPPSQPLPWEQHGEIGFGPALVIKPVHLDGDRKPTPVRIQPGVGFNIHISWQIVRYLRVTGYVVESRHTLKFPQGSLGLPGEITSDSMHAYTFGLRLSPSLPLGTRARVWATVGAGWGRLEYPRLTVTEATKGSYVVRERAAAVAEVPLGAGGSFELIPRWLALQLEVTGALVPSQISDAMREGQAIDSAGKMRGVGPMPRLDASIATTLSLSLLL